VIVGAGPAGATAALNLAPCCKVLLIDARSEPSPRIGESLAPAARRLLVDMGLWEDFLRDGHTPCYLKQSVWGAPEPVSSDSLRDLDGPSYRLDRRRFEMRLRATAEARGAALLVPARVRSIARGQVGITLQLHLEQRPLAVQARVLIDASGRNSRLLYPLGATRRAYDALICGWLRGRVRQREPSSVTYTEAVEDGYWYTAALPDGQRMLAFHTDSNLPAANDLRSASRLLERARRSSSLWSQVVDSDFEACGRPRVCAAHSSMLEPLSGDHWFAAGDAAFSFDPLSSQGLLQALYSGLIVAQAAYGTLLGKPLQPAYVAMQQRIWRAYREHLHGFYSTEQRWSSRPFWARRMGAP